MGTIVDADRLTVRRAVETIEQANRFEEPLRRRTEGATWMVWGLVTAGFFLFPFPTFASPGIAGVAVPLLMLAWVAVAFFMTSAVWRIAGMASPGVKPTRRQTTFAVAGAAGVLAAVGLGLMWLQVLGVYRDPLQMLPIGAMWAVAGASNLRRMTPVGRRVMIAIGIAIALLAVVLALLGVRIYDPADHVMAAAVAGGVPFLGGLWQTLRG